MSVLREIHANGWRVQLDLAGQVLHLEVPEFVIDLRGTPETSGPLLPTPPANPSNPVSAGTLLLKAKQFDDGLFAAAEIAAQQGAGRFSGKAALLRSLAATLADDEGPAASPVFAACELGDLRISPHPSLEPAVRGVVDDFLRDALRSKPLGFYTWTPALQAAFRQDRLLQGMLPPEAVTALARALDRTEGGWLSYDACLRLTGRLTNPAARGSLREANAPGPSSRPPAPTRAIWSSGCSATAPSPRGST